MSDDVKTRIQLRESLAQLFTLEYEHLPAEELLSEAAACFVVCSILAGLEKDIAMEIAAGAYDQLHEHSDTILSMRVAGPIAEA